MNEVAPSIRESVRRRVTRSLAVATAASGALLVAAATAGAAGTSGSSQWATAVSGAFGAPGTIAFGSTSVTAEIGRTAVDCSASRTNRATPTLYRSTDSIFYTPAPPDDAVSVTHCLQGGGRTATRTVAFSKPVIGPVFSINNIDASYVTLSAGPSGGAIALTTLSKDPPLTLTGGNRLANSIPTGSAGCWLTPANPANNSGCGSFQMTEAGGSVRSFTLTNTNPSGGADGWMWTLSFPTAPLTKSFSPSRIPVGGASTLTFTITNPNEAGQVDMPGLDFTDSLPAGLQLADGNAADNGRCGPVSVTDAAGGALAAGATSVRASNVDLAVGETCTITVNVSSAMPGTYTNDADNLSSTIGNVVPDASATVEVHPSADLSIVKRALSARLVPGRQLAYELTVFNHGPSVARDVRVSDSLPSGLSFVSASSGCAFASGTVTCTAGELAVGRSITYSVVTSVAASVTDDSVTNTATVDSDTRDPDPSNNRDTASAPSDPEADLSIVKVPSVEQVAVGGQLFYTLLIRNDGPSDAQRVVVTDAAGAGLTLLSASGGEGSSCTVAAVRATCRLGTLPAGGTAQVLVSARAEQAGVVTNTAKVDSPAKDPRPSNNRDERSVTVDPPPPPSPGTNVPQPADLEIVKTSNRRAIVGSGTITYTLTVRNNGPGAVRGVQVIDTPSLPIKVRSIRASVGRCTTTVPIRCDLGTLQPGASVTIRIVAQPKAPGPLRNSASVTGDVPDPGTGNNIDGTSTKVQGLLKIKKTASAKTVRAGGTLTYEIRVTNASAFALRSVRVCDALPSGLVFVASTPKATLAKGKRCWTIRALGAKKSKTFTLTARVLRGAGGRKVNTATATAPNARGARTRAATGTAAIRVLPAAARGGGVTG